MLPDSDFFPSASFFGITPQRIAQTRYYMLSIGNVLQRLKLGARVKQSSEVAVEATADESSMLAIAGRYSMTSKARLWATLQAMQHIAREKIDGDLVECGVWKGGNLVLFGLMAKKLGLTRTIWGYDTFEGMSAPTDEDVRISTAETAKEMLPSFTKNGVTEWCYSPYQEVEQNFRREVGDAPLKLIKGKVEDTLSVVSNIPDRIAILRLDTDWYESTRKELDVLYPRLEKGGVLIIDDYGYWAGSKKAVDEYFSDRSVWLHRVDHSCRLVIKK